MRISKLSVTIVATLAAIAADAKCVNHYTTVTLSQVGTTVNPLAAPLRAAIDAQNALGQLESFQFGSGINTLIAVQNTVTGQYVGFVFGYTSGANDPPGFTPEYLAIHLDVPISTGSGS